jgi:hypothetical protein
VEPVSLSQFGAVPVMALFFAWDVHLGDGAAVIICDF